MRIILLAACNMLVLFSSPVHAGYTEVWNPPEARTPTGRQPHPLAKPPKPHQPSRSRAAGYGNHAVRANTALSSTAPALTDRPLRDAPADAPEAPVIRAKELPPVVAPDGTVLRT